MPLKPEPERARGSAGEIAHLQAIIDRRLRLLVPTSQPKADQLHQAMRYVLLAPGKRLRPLLTILASWELGVANLSALDPGCALEMVHAASLIFDDLPSMDDAKLRRGLPTVHIAFGEDVAILAAISLLSRAFGVVNGLSDRPSVRSALVAVLSNAIGSDGLAAGQHRDLRESRTPRDAINIAEANHLKTGLLFVAAVECAAEIAGVRDERLARLQAFAANLGQAFQILDDLRDERLADVMEKDARQDGDKFTMVSLLGQRRAQARLEHYVAEALCSLGSPADAPAPLRRFVSTVFNGLYLS